MNKLISTSQIVDTIEFSGEEWEVCAAADATYEQSTSRVVVELESFLRKSSIGGDGEVRRVDWLPEKRCVTEHAPRIEATQVAHDVFVSWVRRVRQSLHGESLKVPS